MVEYILLVTSVLIVCIYFLNSKNGLMYQAVNGSLNSMVNEINALNSQIQFTSS